MIKYFIIGIIIMYFVFVIIKKFLDIKKGRYCSKDCLGNCEKCNKK